MSLFKKTNEEKLQHFINRLKRKELGAISEIQAEIQELRKEERQLEKTVVESENRISDIHDMYDQYIEAIEGHQGDWAELDDLLGEVVKIVDN